MAFGFLKNWLGGSNGEKQRSIEDHHEVKKGETPGLMSRMVSSVKSAVSSLLDDTDPVSAVLSHRKSAGSTGRSAVRTGMAVAVASMALAGCAPESGVQGATISTDSETTTTVSVAASASSSAEVTPAAPTSKPASKVEAVNKVNTLLDTSTESFKNYFDTYFSGPENPFRVALETLAAQTSIELTSAQIEALHSGNFNSLEAKTARLAIMEQLQTAAAKTGTYVVLQQFFNSMHDGKGEWDTFSQMQRGEIKEKNGQFHQANGFYKLITHVKTAEPAAPVTSVKFNFNGSNAPKKAEFEKALLELGSSRYFGQATSVLNVLTDAAKSLETSKLDLGTDPQKSQRELRKDAFFQLAGKLATERQLKLSEKDAYSFFKKVAQQITRADHPINKILNLLDPVPPAITTPSAELPNGGNPVVNELLMDPNLDKAGEDFEKWINEEGKNDDNSDPLPSGTTGSLYPLEQNGSTMASTTTLGKFVTAAPSSDFVTTVSTPAALQREMKTENTKQEVKASVSTDKKPMTEKEIQARLAAITKDVLANTPEANAKIVRELAHANYRRRRQEVADKFAAIEAKVKAGRAANEARKAAVKTSSRPVTEQDRILAELENG